MEFVPQKFNNDIADERGCNGNRKIGGGNNVRNSPGDAQFPSFSGVRKFAHQQVDIEQEDDERYLDHGPPDRLFHLTEVQLNLPDRAQRTFGLCASQIRLSSLKVQIKKYSRPRRRRNLI